MISKGDREFGSCVIDYRFESYYDDEDSDLTETEKDWVFMRMQNLLDGLPESKAKKRELEGRLYELAKADRITSSRILQSKWWSIVRKYLETHALFAQMSPYGAYLFKPDPEYLAEQGYSYIYFLIDAQGDILYIGQTNNVYVRTTQHKRGGIIPFVKVLQIEYNDLFSPITISNIEHDFIALFDPPYNVVHSPRKNHSELATWRININISSDPETIFKNRLVFDTTTQWLGSSPDIVYEQAFLLGLNTMLSNPSYMRYIWRKLSLPDDPLAKMEKHKYTTELNWEI